MKEYIKETLFLCGGIRELQSTIYIESLKVKRWIEDGHNVDSNRKVLIEKINPSIEALEKVENLEQLFNLLKD